MFQEQIAHLVAEVVTSILFCFVDARETLEIEAPCEQFFPVYLRLAVRVQAEQNLTVALQAQINLSDVIRIGSTELCMVTTPAGVVTEFLIRTPGHGQVAVQA